MVIDCHTHILNKNALREYLAKYKADRLFCIRFFKGFCGGIFDDREESFDEFICEYDNLYVIEAIDFDINILDQLDNIRAKIEEVDYIKGLKLYTGYQHFSPYHERLFPIYNFAKEYSIPVVFHSGALYEYENSNALLKYTNPIEIDEIAARYSDVNFVISHFGFPYMMETAMVLNKNNNVYTDISGVIDSECYDVFKDDLKRILKYFPEITDQIMFGTDFIGDDTSLNEVELYVRFVEEVFGAEDKELVFYKNAQKVYGL